MMTIGHETSSAQAHEKSWQTTGCPICHSRQLSEFFALRGVPTQDGVLWATPEEAHLAPIGDIRLVVCADCGYIGNELYDASKVRFTGYDVSLQHSPSFHAFTESLAKRLIARYSLTGATCLDIGCGRGDFLRTLCRLGAARGVGFDPSFVEEKEEEAAKSATTFIRDYYAPSYGDYEADLITCRHVLDILEEPAAFLTGLRGAITPGRRPVVYFESPDARHTIGRKILWNIVYEHRSWFTPESYRTLFERSGFDVLAVESCWNDEYLGLEAVPSSSSEIGRSHARSKDAAAAIAQTVNACLAFGSEFDATMSEWHVRLARYEAHNKHVALWGSGARGISFLNFFRDQQDLIRTVIDINPKRQGKYLPLSAQRVSSPEQALKEVRRHDRPEIIIISNPTYEHEIHAQAKALGYQGEFITI